VPHYGAYRTRVGVNANHVESTMGESSWCLVMGPYPTHEGVGLANVDAPPTDRYPYSHHQIGESASARSASLSGSWT
jgi:hypothetical protein